jgi:hypothetical protein
MRWEDGNRYGGVEDRRGVPMGVAGGGIGAIALGILGYVFFGINPLTIVTAGKYQINWGFLFTAAAAGTLREGRLILNAATIIGDVTRIPLTSNISIEGATEYLLGVGDTIGVQAFQNSGSAQAVLGIASYSPFITVRKVG